MTPGSSRRALAAALVLALAAPACDEKPSPDKPAPAATAALTAAPTATATASDSATATESASAAPTAEPSAAATAEPAPTATAVASATATATTKAATPAKPKPTPTSASASSTSTAVPSASADASAAPTASAAAEIPPPAEGSADAIAQKIDGVFSASKKDFTAKFKQRLEQKVSGTKKESTGVLFIERPNKVSFRYDAPNKNRIVSDGTTLKAYVAEDSQMFESKVGSSAYAGGLAFFMGGLLKTMSFTFNEKADYKAGYVLIGKPRTPSPTYEYVMFYINKDLLEKGEPTCIERIVIIDAQGNKNRFDFTESSFPASVPATEWEFTPPPGTNITKN
jgi:outer membrane lipoprotein carrier protein